jgi:uncharacterized protein (TIGR04255 family)
VFELPLPRVWFVDSGDNAIVQVQRDRFLHNWKKVRDDDEYPRYSRVIQQFRGQLAIFESFIAELGLGTLQATQYEMTYVNHVVPNDADVVAKIGALFPDFSWRNANRFLPLPEAVNWRTSFLLPEHNGRLHAALKTAKRVRDGMPILMLEMTARGMPASPDREVMWNWFDLAHEWIVRGFGDLTSDEAQFALWEKTR